jgi:DNA-binding transcriptional LysR family regulator
VASFLAMDLRQLAALVAVADHGTFSAAAEALHTVQSNVSTHVARLEKELGATLVDRAAGRLTEEGVAVVERARRIRLELEAMAADVSAMGSEVRGDVRLGVLGTTGRWLVPRLVDRLSDRHPAIHMTVSEGTSANILPRLVAGTLDLALLTLPVSSSDIKTNALFDEDLLLVAPEDDPLARAKRLTVADLAGTKLLLPAPGTVFRAELDADAARAGITLQAKAELDGVRLLASLAFEGFAPAIVPASSLPRWLSGPFRAVSVDGLTRRRIGLATRARGLPAAPAKAVAVVLREVVADEVLEQTGVHLPG